MNATMSIYGLWNYDNTVFDNFVLPAGIPKDDVISNLMTELAELECLYPSAPFMKFAIGAWSNKELPKWEKQNETLHFVYNPLNNAYRDETTTNIETKNLTNTNTPNITTADSGTDTDTNYTSGFNDTEAVMEGKTDNTKGTQSHTTGTTTNTDSGTDTTTSDFHLEGSIGVITPQNMIQQERAVDEFNIIDYIINDFKNRFCLLKY